jgi:glycosyltransferase involved in cell wall biosynthesis
MQISVVVPTYKRPDLLKQCLNALARQTYDRDKYEVIVVSDGPDDLTQNVVKELQAKNQQIRFFSLPENRGPAAARNAGWLSAKGAIIAFTDDDCLPDKNWLLEIDEHLTRYNVGAVSGRVVVPRKNRPTDYELNTAGLETAEFVTANCACTKTVLISTGGFDERFRMAWREDSDLHFKLISQKIPIAYLPAAIVVHPVREPQWGVSLKEQKKTLFNALLYQKYPEMYRQRIQPLPPVLYYFIVAAAVVMIVGLISKTDVLFNKAFLLWATLTLYFIGKRLYKTSLTPLHIIEMILTSIFIPFLSIYWQWYGAVKYRVFFI